MSPSGRLEDRSLPELLRVLSRGEETGRLTLCRHDSYGVVFLRQGRILYAACSAVGGTLEGIFTCEQLILASTGGVSTGLPQRSQREVHLAAILVEMGTLQREVLAEMLREETRKALVEIGRWRSGHFSFESMEVPADRQVEMPAGEVFQELAEEEWANGLREDPVTPRADLDRLKATMAEISTLGFTGDISLRLLQYAAQAVDRGVLFAATRESILGLGQFGIEADRTSANRRVHGIQIPLDEPSVFSEVVASGSTYLGALSPTPWNDYLVAQLGGHRPEEVVVLPLIVRGSVFLLLYGDNLPDNRPIGSVESLEVLMLHAGLAMDKAILEERLRHAEGSRGEGGYRPQASRGRLVSFPGKPHPRPGRSGPASRLSPGSVNTLQVGRRVERQDLDPEVISSGSESRVTRQKPPSCGVTE